MFSQDWVLCPLLTVHSVSEPLCSDTFNSDTSIGSSKQGLREKMQGTQGSVTLPKAEPTLSRDRETSKPDKPEFSYKQVTFQKLNQWLLGVGGGMGSDCYCAVTV